MSKLDLIITVSATSDMELIADYIAKDKKSVATKMLKLFQKSFETLSDHPELGVKRPDFTYKNIMFYIVKKRYVIAYKIHNNNLVILRVLTAYQDICALL